MIERGSGGIINVASTAAFQAVPNFSTYGASKAYVLNFSIGLAEEVRRHGVKIMALCPGPVPTGFQSTAGMVIAKNQKSAVLSAEETAKIALRAYEKGKVICVPGAMNQIAAFATRFLGRSFVARLADKMVNERAEE
jgi:hypothetical protein